MVKKIKTKTHLRYHNKCLTENNRTIDHYIADRSQNLTGETRILFVTIDTVFTFRNNSRIKTLTRDKYYRERLCTYHQSVNEYLKASTMLK